MPESTIPGKNPYVVDFKDDSVTPWKELSPAGKAKLVAIILVKVCLILGALYFFICSLSFLADGFRLVAGKKAGEVFRNSLVFNNPVAGKHRPRTPNLAPNPHLALTSPQPPFSNPNSNPDPCQACSWACS